MRFVDRRQVLLARIPEAFRMSVYDVEREAKSNAPVGPTRIAGDQRIAHVRNSPGQLRQSVHSEFFGSLRARVGSSLPYARIRDQGGTITAKRAKYLRFQTYDGAWHMVRQVHQTGTHWLTNAGRRWVAFFTLRLRQLT